MFSYLGLGLPLVAVAALVGCGPDYSPNTYSTAAVQQANKVDQGVIAGFREVAIRADGTIGAVTGGAAGGVLGAQEPDGGVVTALSAIGGTLIGGLVGTGVEHAAGDTTAFEYLVRKTGGDLIALTQKDMTPLAVGLKVLVIEGKQARIVPDYSVPLEAPTPSSAGTTGKNEKSSGDKADKTNKPGATDKGDTANVAPSAAPKDTGPAPAPQSAPGETPPAPASGATDSMPAPQSPVPQAPVPQAAAPADLAPPTTAPSSPEPPATAAAPPATPADQGGSTPPAVPAAPADAPPPAGTNPTP